MALVLLRPPLCSQPHFTFRVDSEEAHGGKAWGDQLPLPACGGERHGTSINESRPISPAPRSLAPHPQAPAAPHLPAAMASPPGACAVRAGNMRLPGPNGVAWYIGNNTTMVPCGKCPEEDAFCAAFHGVRARASGKLVPLSCKRLPDVPGSMSASESKANEESLEAMMGHYAVAHPHTPFEVRQCAC